MVLDVGGDSAAKVPLQSALSANRIKIVSNINEDHGPTPHSLSSYQHNRGADGGNGQVDHTEMVPLRKPDNVSPTESQRKASTADSRIYGISRIFGRFSRFIHKGIDNDRPDTIEEMDETAPLYKTTPRRWIILFVFALYSMSNAFQWISYSIITDKIVFFYDVSAGVVDWLSMIYMLTSLNMFWFKHVPTVEPYYITPTNPPYVLVAWYIPLVFPATWLLDKKGLRIVALIGSFGNFVGSAVKCFSPYPDRFAVTFVGQTISAISQIFILGLPARLAAVWFGSSEVAVATAIGVFGNQLGVALGFLLPPILVPTVNVSDSATGTIISNDTVKDLYGQNLSTMFYGSTAINGFLFLVVLFVFQDAPRYPPSPAQAAVLAEAANTTYANWIIALVKNRNFWMLLLSYGINVGAFYAISTLLNQCILHFFPTEHENVGRIGLTIVLAGLVGSFVGGLWLSWSGNYKTTTFVIYLLSFLSMIAFTATLNLGQLWLVFVIAGLLGFFMTGYLPVGFEFAAEITYPAPEGTSSGLLNCSAQIFGFILTAAMGAVLARWDPITANGAIAAILFFGTVMTFFIKSDLRRTTVTNSINANSGLPLPTIQVENVQIHH